MQAMDSNLRCGEGVCILHQSGYLFRLEFHIPCNLCQLSSVWGQFPFPIMLVVLPLEKPPERQVIFEINLISI